MDGTPAGGRGLRPLPLGPDQRPQIAAVRHGWDLLRLERHLHFDFDISINRFVAARPRLALPCDFYFATLHFAVTIGVLIWLCGRQPDRYRRARRVIVAGTLISLAIFWLYPAARPDY